MIGDSIANRLDGFLANSLNLGIGGDRVEDVRWRSEELSLNESVRTIVLVAGTNNLDQNSPTTIADELKGICEEYLV